MVNFKICLAQVQRGRELQKIHPSFTRWHRDPIGERNVPIWNWLTHWEPWGDSNPSERNLFNCETDSNTFCWYLLKLSSMEEMVNENEFKELIENHEEIQIQVKEMCSYESESKTFCYYFRNWHRLTVDENEFKELI